MVASCYRFEFAKLQFMASLTSGFDHNMFNFSSSLQKDTAFVCRYNFQTGMESAFSSVYLVVHRRQIVLTEVKKHPLNG